MMRSGWHEEYVKEHLKDAQSVLLRNSALMSSFLRHLDETFRAQSMKNKVRRVYEFDHSPIQDEDGNVYVMNHLNGVACEVDDVFLNDACRMARDALRNSGWPDATVKVVRKPWWRKLFGDKETLIKVTLLKR